MPGLIERYRDRLPVTDATPVVELGEGSTPLLTAPRISEMTGCRVLLKYEGLNPTGSFKDRGMTVAVSKALEEGATVAVCASTGNTSASAAAYCGRAGIRLAVVLPEGAIARGKLAQAQICGARVIAVQGSFDDALRLVRELVERHPIALLNSINPYRLEGQKTAAFEVLETLDGAAGLARAARRQRRQHLRLLEGVHRDGRGAADAGRPGRGGRAASDRRPGARPADGGDRHPHRQSGPAGPGAGRRVGVERRHPGDRRRRHPGRVPAAGPGGGRVLRAGVRSVRGGPARGGASTAWSSPGRRWSAC